MFGAAGPSAFDCSGLTMAAWARLGSPATFGELQKSRTRQGRLGQLDPGDLVFFYSDIHHVGMYVGGGMFVSRREPH